MSLVSSCCQTAKLCLKEKKENNPKGCNKDNALFQVSSLFTFNL